MQANFLNNQLSSDKSGPGSWNDPDMRMIGNNSGLTIVEQKTQFALWSIAKAPLILSTDLTNLGDKSDPDTPAAIITNEHLIKINQDKLGQQAEEIEFDDGTTNSDLHYYKSVVEGRESGDLYQVLLVINWTSNDVTEDA
jgi:alpha-galactosidase